MDIGAQLRQARESRGLSIADVSAATRIQPRLLEALERNDLSVVPPHPYARGFVTALAREVGLNPAEIVREYFGQFETAPAVAESVSPSVCSQSFQSRSWALSFGSLALVFILALVFWSRTDTRVEEPAAVATSVAAHALGDTAGSPRGTSGVAPARHGVPPASDLSPTSSTIVVVLETRGPSWVTAIVDGERRLYRIVPAGTKTTLRGAREIAIRVGDAGAVRWSVNGRASEAMGAPGEVRDVRLTPGS